MRMTNRESRLAVVALAILVAVGRAMGTAAPDPKPVDLNGLWLMKETYPDYHGQLRLTWLEIVQDGPHVTMRAWQDDDVWRCDGKGRVEGNRLRLRWWGKDKYWRG